MIQSAKCPKVGQATNFVSRDLHYASRFSSAVGLLGIDSYDRDRNSVHADPCTPVAARGSFQTRLRENLH